MIGRFGARAAFCGLAAAALAACAQESESNGGGDPVAKTFGGLSLRSIGPAYSSGRISDFAFHPERDNIFYAATASAGVWKTETNGASWTPVFDNEASFATGVIELDPTDPETVWVGTGENNAQRSVGFGDGVYKSTDGGATWNNMGLEDSGHIGQIRFHPDDADTVYVAAQGPLWSDGGDRGLYKTTDGGETWERILEIDPHTGVNEFVIHPDRPNEIVASSWQRRRHVWVLINGGPGSALHKSHDGGETWTKLGAGLPGKGDLGRIGLAQAPSAPNVLYAIIEAARDDEKGVYRSDDFGETWSKMSDEMTTSPQYYNELVVDPTDPDTVYMLNTFTQVSRDGGKTWSWIGLEHRHVDDHALRIDSEDPQHMHIGGDGGIYETYDGGKTWEHMENLPIVQFYRATPDNDAPFYNVCGGTQDNNSLCGPSRTARVHGVANWDWKIILGGDGYKPVFDPRDPNIIYAQYQYGGLARYDRRTQERVFIVPHPGAGENDYKWNWNTPIIVSPHDPNRIYYAAEKLFRSDDRGDSWRAVSPDLTRQLDRNALEVMGRVWSVDAVAKNDSTSIYGSAIALAESTFEEGLIYVGTDDGLIQVTEDGGQNWRSVGRFRGVPEMSLVEDIIASVHDPDVAYAVMDNHKRGDHKPYVLKTTNRGRNWSLISGDLPERGAAHTIAEDHEDPDLLFVGTEFGLFVTQNGGGAWTRLKNGLPTIAVRDLEIQRRENDLVVGTFGRGIYILDDYRPLRVAAADVASAEATLFPVRDSYLYVEGDYWGGTGTKGNRGATFFASDNPPYGVTFTYHLRDGLKTPGETRLEEEKEKAAAGEDTPYPSWEELRAEDRADRPIVLLTIRNADGDVVRRVTGPTKAGLHRIAWDMRLPAPNPIRLQKPSGPRSPYASDPEGPIALPGQYAVDLSVYDGEEWRTLGAPQSFVLKSMERSPEEAEGEARLALHAVHNRTSDLIQAVLGAQRAMGEMNARVAHLKAAFQDAPDAEPAHHARARELELRLADVEVAINGDRTIASRNEPAPLGVLSRVYRVAQGNWGSLAPAGGNHRDSLAIAKTEFEAALADLRAIEEDLAALEEDADAVGARWTPGRLPSSPAQ